MFVVLSRLMMLILMLTIITTNNIPSTAVSQEEVVMKPVEPFTESFLTYNDTIYGFSINYPSTWEVDESASQYLHSILENISSSDLQGMKQGQNIDITSKVSDVLEAFGLEKVSEVLGLKPDVRLDFFQKLSQALNERTV